VKMAYVRVALSAPVSEAEAAERARNGASFYEGVPGLLAKHYLRSGDGSTVGGVYLWESKEVGETFFAGEWRQRIAALNGSDPDITWFEAPVVIDNVHGEIFSDED
jgi:heme-degrading monooxygenase HmoA